MRGTSFHRYPWGVAEGSRGSGPELGVAAGRVAVLVATSGRRTAMLLERALPSVYRQVGVTPERVQVLVVDDNSDESELMRIRTGIEGVREALGLDASAFITTAVRNERTRGQSGTGAWNTGLGRLAGDVEPPEWVAILDDDDEFTTRHIGSCLGAARAGVVGIFEQLEWVRDAAVESRCFSAHDLTPEAFFVGNPGVQGSNLFVCLAALVAIGGFDESLASATDRDLMIRLLGYAKEIGASVCALPTVGARYHDHRGPRVNTDRARKREGLDRFFEKHESGFGPEPLAAALERARRLFGYERTR